MEGPGKHTIFFSVTFFIVLLDQLSKYLLSSYLKAPFSILGSFFRLTLTHNYGAGFSILQNWLWLFILFGFLVIAIIAYYYKDIPDNISVLLGASFILAGTIGNLIDRIIFGYVIDFIDIWIWPVFNVADSSITVGAVLLIIYFWQR